ncbi:PIG-L family deacetylase [Oceanispirochaeta crateris]|uniref:PIG-L family deacetylase n=1 Tax=Oceanispirochaeta crateris TaxID=2518645 RepID=A0A5C1QN53_9SPIO|nr:PIG-L family deacetylase [Oceanispirochaeta crateris]QEN08768.1 PIG-L family deacetylase [Oceanispirochaeta crateris]
MRKSVAVIVAHPDDETLWAAGTILTEKFEDCFILSLCRLSDTDRSPKFFRVLDEWGASGAMADLDDGPEQLSLDEELITSTILSHLPRLSFDMIYTHSPAGEYTRHKRHEEIGRTVLNLWISGRLRSQELRLFAYEDRNKSTLPKSISSAPVQCRLDQEIWQKKYRIITDIYGFNKDSFEARTTPEQEAFWQFTSTTQAAEWLKKDI